MGLTAEDIVAVYTTVTATVISPIACLSLSFFVYGIYIIIFGSALRVLHKRRSSEYPLSALYYWWIVSLFVLATIYVALICWLYVNQAVVYFTAAKTRVYERFLQYLKDDKPKTAVFTTLTLVSTLVNIVAESMLIHRCFVIWNSSKLVLWVLGSVSFVMNSIGLIGAAMMGKGMPFIPENAFIFATGTNICNAYSIANTGFNSLITIITATRIWLISRPGRAVMGDRLNRRYKIIVAILLESGMLYPVPQLISIGLQYGFDPNVSGVVPFDLGPVIVQAAGIAPTLILVRAAYGVAVETTHQGVSTLRVATRATTTSGVLEPAAGLAYDSVDGLNRDVERYGTDNESNPRKSQ